jgi:PAS domain S-box-containing protein
LRRHSKPAERAINVTTLELAETEEIDTRSITPTDDEVTFRDDEIIVSKTDLKGHITYVNRVFIDIAGYTEAELLGKPHSIIRHPDMPRTVFRYLWDTIAAGDEIFAYVKNMTRSGAYYWVFAHVTPTFGPDGKIVGHHSNRRTPDRDALEKIMPIYDALLEAERSVPNRKEGLENGVKLLEATLNKAGKTYDEFIFSLDADSPERTEKC